MFGYKFITGIDPYTAVSYDYVKFYGISVWAKIIKIVMRDWVNHKIVLPNTLLYFKMGSMFNKPIDLPETLIYFNMGFMFQQSVELPNILQCLIMGHDYNYPIALPKTLLCLTIGCSYNCPLILPKTLCYLEIQSKSKHLYGMTLPESLKTIICYKNLDFYSNDCMIGTRWVDSIPNSVKIVGCKYDHVPIAKILPNLPNSVKYVINSNVVYKYNNLLKNYICAETNRGISSVLKKKCRYTNCPMVKFCMIICVWK